MSSHKVMVTVQGGEIRVSPDPVVLTSADELHWSCASSDRFEIEFDGPSPFAARKLAHADANSPQRPQAKGRFKYTVSLESDPSVRLDPEVIVGDPPSTPGP